MKSSKTTSSPGRNIACDANLLHMNDRVWENDAYWGDLLDHPERKRLFEEKRQRIGAVYGELHYFPGW